jgi:hypothetical protein
VRHAPPKRLFAAPLGVHVVRKKIAGLAGVQDDIGFGDGTAAGLTACVDDVILEELFADHVSPPPLRGSDLSAPATPGLFFDSSSIDNCFHKIYIYW